jgi:hypothetical protein
MFVQILGVDYKKGLLHWMDEENLPTFLGGKSQGSLADDFGPWSDPELCTKIGVNIEDLRAGKKLQSLLHMGTMKSRRYAAAATASSSALTLGAIPRLSESGPQRDSGGSSGFNSPRGGSAESISK